jgi:hypothetical protein
VKTEEVNRSVNVKFLRLTKHHAVKTYWGSGGRAPRILWPRHYYGGEWSASRPGRCIPREGARVTHWIGDWMGPRDGVDTVVKRRIPSPRRESNLDHPIVQPVVSRYTNWAIPVLVIVRYTHKIRIHNMQIQLKSKQNNPSFTKRVFYLKG